MTPTGNLEPTLQARGIAFDPSDGNIWYTVTIHNQQTGSSVGDGLIHKKPAFGGADITTIPEPGGFQGPGIAALEYDPEEDALWASSFLAVGNQTKIYKLDPRNGNVLKTFTLNSAGSCCGNDSLAIARPTDLGRTKVILTDAGNNNTTTLFALDVNSGAVLRTYPVSGLGGIDVDDVTGNLLARVGGFIRNLGPAPYNTILGSLLLDNRVPIYQFQEITLDDVTPLVFVPGVAGSVLKDVNDGELWPGVFTDHAALTLDPRLPQRNIIATDVLRSIKLLNITKLTIYEELILKMKAPLSQGGGGYVEYNFNGNPAICNLSQAANRPTLFVFPYDWRKSGVENAGLLSSYIGCIRQLFAKDTRVNIVAHSMGGYVSRRYILDNPETHRVNNLITIGTMWVGTPKAIYGLETGDIGFFPLIRNSTSKALLEFFPSAHELMPSQQYFTLGGRPLAEAGFDLNTNRQKFETYNTYNQFVSILNRRYPINTSALPMGTPGTNNELFHSRQGQDDWRTDSTGVKYAHIYGLQRSRKTIEKVLAKPTKKCDAAGANCVTNVIFDTVRGFGDGTVIRLSAERRGNNLDLNAPGARVLQFASTGDDRVVEHTGLTKNPAVHSEILRTVARRGSSQLQGPVEPAGDEIPDEPAYFLLVNGVDYVTVTDAFGNDNNPIGDTLFRGEVPEVQFDPLGDKSFEVIMPTDIASGFLSYTITFRSGTEPLVVELLKGQSKDAPTAAIRYRDVNLPPNVMVRLNISDAGISDLRYDSDGDGEFETIIPPSASVGGSLAGDIDPPVVNISGTYQQNTAQVTLTATDVGSGVRTLRYSLDGVHYQSYANPFAVNMSQNPSVYVFADDNVANRSVESRFDLSPVFSPAGQYILSRGDDRTVAVTAPGTFTWTCSSNDDWIIVTSPGGSGNGVVTYSVRDNSTGSPRQGTMTIANKVFVVIQDGGSGANCTFTISPSSNSFTANGGTGSVSVSAGQSCAWQAVSSVAWITVTSGNAGISSGTVTYSVAPNTDNTPRDAIITIAGKPFPIKQSP